MNVYDFDKTIYKKDSTIEFYKYCLKSKKCVLWAVPRQLWGMGMFILGLYDRNKFKESFFSFLQYLSDVKLLTEQFWEIEHVNIKEWYIEKRKYDDVIISASPSFLLKPIMERLGIQNLIATEVDMNTGKLLSENCKGENKVIRFKEVYQDAVIDEMYSDSDSDMPLANISRKAFKVQGNKLKIWKEKSVVEDQVIKNGDNPVIGVIIAAYNAEKYIRDCLGSVKAQTYQNWIAYVVNDESTDHTAALVQEYVMQDKRFLLLNKKNGGCVAARRYGIDHAKGCDYLTFLDSDDYYLENDLLERIVGEMRNEKGMAVCFNYLINGKRKFSTYKNRYIFEGEKDIIKNVYCRKMIDGNLQFAVYPYDIVDLYFEKLTGYEDYVRKIQILLHCDKVVYIPGNAYFYRVNLNSVTHKEPKEKEVGEGAEYYFLAVQHTQKMKEKYPELAVEADYFCQWVLLWYVATLSKYKFSRNLKSYKTMMKIMWKNHSIYMKNPYFSKKDRTTYILIRMHLFRILYRLRHIVK